MENDKFALCFTVTGVLIQLYFSKCSMNQEDDAVAYTDMLDNRLVLSSWYNIDYTLSLLNKESTLR